MGYPYLPNPYPQNPGPPGYPPNPYAQQAYAQQAEAFQMAQDESNLRMLSIFHFVYGGIMGLLTLGCLVYVIMGIAMAAGTGTSVGELVGGVIAIFGVILTVVVGVKAGLLLAAGYGLARKKHHTLCIVAACFSFLGIPLGTVLGVCTLIMLTKPNVKRLFENAALQGA